MSKQPIYYYFTGYSWIVGPPGALVDVDVAAAVLFIEFGLIGDGCWNHCCSNN